MFNKPAFGRNEPAARRDTVPALTSSTRPAAAERGTPAAPPSSPAASSAPANSAYAQRPANAANAAATGVSAAMAGQAAASDQGKEDDVPGTARLIVGPAVKLKGAEILDCDTLVVEGRVEATMDSRRIRIAENGSFAGTVSIDVAEIHGRFEGELTARSQLIIHATGRVSGTIRFGKLVVAEGGELNGEISVITQAAALPARASSDARVALDASAA